MLFAVYSALLDCTQMLYFDPLLENTKKVKSSKLTYLKVIPIFLLEKLKTGLLSFVS